MTDAEIIKAYEDKVNLIASMTSVYLDEEDGFDLYTVMSNALDLNKRQKAEIERLEYVLLGVMHSVDKWLDGEELKQDKVNRAATMREKTLQITEKQKAEIERLNGLLEEWKKAGYKYADSFDSIKAEAIKGFAERLKYRTCCIPQHHFTYAEVEQHIDYLVKEMVGDT